jgi:hypothetical protein
MDHHHILHFVFVLALTAIFLIGGLGNKEQQNGLLTQGYFFFGGGGVFGPKGMSADQSQEHLLN